MPVNHGLDTPCIDAIVAVFKLFPSVCWVRLYGSRATGQYKKQSDIDLAYFDEAPKSQKTSIYTKLMEIPTLLHIDLTEYNAVTHKKLLQHIDSVGVLLYRRTKNT